MKAQSALYGFIGCGFQALDQGSVEPATIAAWHRKIFLFEGWETFCLVTRYPVEEIREQGDRYVSVCDGCIVDNGRISGGYVASG